MNCRRKNQRVIECWWWEKERKDSRRSRVAIGLAAGKKLPGGLFWLLRNRRPGHPCLLPLNQTWLNPLRKQSSDHTWERRRCRCHLGPRAIDYRQYGNSLFTVTIRKYPYLTLMDLILHCGSLSVLESFHLQDISTLCSDNWRAPTSIHQWRCLMTVSKSCQVEWHKDPKHVKILKPKNV